MHGYKSRGVGEKDKKEGKFRKSTGTLANEHEAVLQDIQARKNVTGREKARVWGA